MLNDGDDNVAFPAQKAAARAGIGIGLGSGEESSVLRIFWLLFCFTRHLERHFFCSSKEDMWVELAGAVLPGMLLEHMGCWASFFPLALCSLCPHPFSQVN